MGDAPAPLRLAQEAGASSEFVRIGATVTRAF